jgi:hypothetical protein
MNHLEQFAPSKPDKRLAAQRNQPLASAAVAQPGTGERVIQGFRVRAVAGHSSGLHFAPNLLCFFSCQ